MAEIEENLAPVVQKIWEMLAEQALEIADSLNNATCELEHTASRLQTLISMARSMKPPAGSEDRVKATIIVWEATRVQVERMIAAMRAAGPQ